MLKVPPFTRKNATTTAAMIASADQEFFANRYHPKMLIIAMPASPQPPCGKMLGNHCGRK